MRKEDATRIISEKVVPKKFNFETTDFAKPVNSSSKSTKNTLVNNCSVSRDYLTSQQSITVKTDLNFKTSIDQVPSDSISWGNVLPLLYEIRHGIARWLNKQQNTVIDLRRIPLAKGEQELIEEALGVGEVEAKIHAFGETSVVETKIPGAWLITHFNSHNEIMSKYIEATDVPSILKSQAVDMKNGLTALDDYLQELSDQQQYGAD